MKAWHYMIIGAGAIIALFLSFRLGQEYPHKSPVEPLKEKVDTLVIRDTIKVTEPLYVTRRVVDSVAFPVTDTLRMRDTLFVYLEKEQIRWEDSLSVVYASGVNPQVDSVIHHTRDAIITKEIPVIQVKKTRWGIGIQAGYGAYKYGVSPYIGLGISYNFIMW